MQLLDGKAISSQIKSEIKIEVENWMASGGKKPHLAAILVGQDGASETYVASKIRSCEEIGFTSTYSNSKPILQKKPFWRQLLR